MASQAEILQSLHIAQRVAERGNLFDNPEFNAALSPPGLLHRFQLELRNLLGMETDAAPDDPVYGPVLDPTRDRTMLAVKDRLHASPVRFSHVIEVTFVADDPVVAAAAVNNAMDAYIKDQYAAKHRLVETATELLEKEAADLRRQVRQAEERISSYRGEHAMSQGMHAATGNEEITHLDRGSRQSPVGTGRRECPPGCGTRQGRRRSAGRGRALGGAVAQRSWTNSPARCRRSAAAWAAPIPMCRASTANSPTASAR